MKNSIILNILTLTILTLAACSSINNSDEPIEVGNKAPEFTLQSLAGNQVKLSDFSGKVVLLFIFGNG